MKNSGALCKISDCKISFFYIFKPEELENKWFRKNCKFSTQLFHWNNAFEAYWIGKIRALELCIACVLLLKNLLPAEKLRCIGTSTLVMTHDHDHELQKTVPMLSWFCQNSSCTTYPSIIIHLNTSPIWWPVSEGPILQIILSPRPQKRPFPPRAPAAPL